MTSGIIIADDDSVIRGILRSVLVAARQHVFIAINGEEAVNLASKMQARLLLLDLDMPVVNGLVACERIRSLPGYASTPIVMLTIHVHEEAKRAAAHVGVTQFVKKPFQPLALLHVLSPFLDFDTATLQALSRDAKRANEISALKRQLVQDRIRANFNESTHEPNVLDNGKSVLEIYRRVSST